MSSVPILSQRFSFFTSFGLTLFIMLLLAACQFGQEQPEAPTAQVAVREPTAVIVPATATPETRGGNLTIRLDHDVETLRPWQPRSRGEEQISGLLYSGLMRLDAELRPQPDLAESWDTTPDGRILTFTLRSGLSWHDGEPLTASDVRYTLDTLRSLPFTTTALLAELQRIGSVITPNERTVVISMTERFAPILSELTLPILPRHLLEGKDVMQVNFWDIPIGSGPFQLADRQAGQSIVLSANKKFHRGAPFLERVAFVVAPDTNITLQALSDERLLLAELPWNVGSTISETHPNLRSASYTENGYYFLGFNLREGHLFADARVREALAVSIDMPRLIEVATKGQGQAIASSAAPGSWADLTPVSTTLDLDRARMLLDEAGWTLPAGSTIRQREGISLTTRLYVRGDDERRIRAAQVIAESASRVGISLVVEPADFASTFLSKYAPPFDFDILLGSWLNGAGDPNFGDYKYYDPDDFGLFHSTQINQGPADTRVARNFVGFSDSAYDNQSEAARQLYDTEARINSYRQTQARIAELRPYIFLWADRIPVALNNKVTTADGPVDLASPNYLWNIERWYVEP